jgi:hypothetical protein
MDGNREAVELLQAGASQIRTGGMGGFVGYDWVALRQIAEDYGFDTSPALWKKIRAVETVISRNEAKKMKERS